MVNNATTESPERAGLILFPEVIRPQRDHIPVELRERPQWVVWKFEPKPEKPGEYTKVPYSRGGKASGTNPATWLTFDDAWALYETGYKGVGFVFAEDDPFTGIDLDAKVPQDDKDRIVADLNSYTEASPSGAGLHIIVRATTASHKHDGCEVYSRARYFTFTGARVAGPSEKIEDRQDALDLLCRRIFPIVTPTTPKTTSHSKTDRAILDRIFAGARGEGLRKTWKADASDGDYALAARVREEVGDDPAWIEQVMRVSPFVRDKYDEMRGEETYLQRTIREMIERNGDGIVRPVHEMLADVERLLRRFVIFTSPAQTTALALWVLHTHTIDAADTTPYIAVTAPDRESGKTRLFEALDVLVARPWRTSVPSDAVVYRKIEDKKPTLLLDETDAIFNPKTGHTYEGLRALLNDGYRRGTPTSRCVGEGAKIELRDFSTFCAKAFAGIGDLPDTIASRCIPIHLVRKLKSEIVSRFRKSVVLLETADLRGEVERWGKGAVEPLRDARPEPILEISDRADEVWEPLLAIADMAGNGWPQRARDAARELYSVGAKQQNWGTELLATVRLVFARSKQAVMPTNTLIAGVKAEMFIPSWSKAKTEKEQMMAAARGLAREMAKWGVEPRSVRTDKGSKRGYRLEDLQPVFDRWLSPMGEVVEAESEPVVEFHEPTLDDLGGEDNE